MKKMQSEGLWAQLSKDHKIKYDPHMWDYRLRMQFSDEIYKKYSPWLKSEDLDKVAIVKTLIKLKENEFNI